MLFFHKLNDIKDPKFWRYSSLHTDCCKSLLRRLMIPLPNFISCCCEKLLTGNIYASLHAGFLKSCELIENNNLLLKIRLIRLFPMCRWHINFLYFNSRVVDIRMDSYKILSVCCAHLWQSFALKKGKWLRIKLIASSVVCLFSKTSLQSAHLVKPYARGIFSFMHDMTTANNSKFCQFVSNVELIWVSFTFHQNSIFHSIYVKN